MTTKIKTILITSIILLLTSCSKESPKYVKSPIDGIITKYIDVPTYSVILSDMDYKEEADKYYHKYQIILENQNQTENPEDDFKTINTDWIEVSPITFEENIKNLGMTVLSKKDGVLDKLAKPAGFDNYVGNEKYGQWKQQSNGSSFWAFYGQYYFLSSMLNGGNRRYYRNDYNDYRNNHRGRSGYYGNQNKYGTSTYKNPNSNWNNKPQNFKQKVRSNVQRSSAALKSKGYRANSSYKNSNTSSGRTSRNTNRYNSSSSSRSRSGGFGK